MCLRRQSFLLLLFLFLEVQPGRADDFSPARLGMDLVYVLDGVVYALDLDPHRGYVRMWADSVRVPENSEPIGRSRAISNISAGAGVDRLRWRIAHDHFWSDQDVILGSTPLLGLPPYSHHIPWEELPLLDPHNEKQNEAALRKKYSIPADDQIVDWGATNFAWPVGGEARSLRLGMNPRPEVIEQGTFETDILPTGPRSFDLFMVHKGRLTVWHGSAGSMSSWAFKHWDFKEADTVRATFQEPFIAYGTSQEPYFITRSGKVYRLFKPEKGPRKVEAIWSAPERPIKAILNDVNAARTFVLGVDWRGENDKRFYFELTAKPAPVEINDGDWPKVANAWWPRPLAVGRMLQFTRYLDAQKKLKIK